MNQKNNSIGWYVIPLTTLAIVLLLIFTLRYLDNRDIYNLGHQAYQQGDCSLAINHFDRLATSRRIFDFGEYFALAHQEKTECVHFLAGVDKQNQKNFGVALVMYNDFVSNFKDSALTSFVILRTAEFWTFTHTIVRDEKSDFQLCVVYHGAVWVSS